VAGGLGLWLWQRLQLCLLAQGVTKDMAVSDWANFIIPLTVSVKVMLSKEILPCVNKITDQIHVHVME
jgi:hypothetical protein